MHLRRPRIGRTALTLAGTALLIAPASASAIVYTDTPDFNLNEWNATYGSYTTTTSSGIQYRWVDSPWKPKLHPGGELLQQRALRGGGLPVGVHVVPGHRRDPERLLLQPARPHPAGYGSMYYYDGRLAR